MSGTSIKVRAGFKRWLWAFQVTSSRWRGHSHLVLGRAVAVSAGVSVVGFGTPVTSATLEEEAVCQ